MEVDDERLGGAADPGAVRGHQPDRASAEDRHRPPRLYPGQLGAVVAGWEDVGQHREILLVLIAGRQLQQVEVRPRHAQVLGLAAPVRPHLRVPVPGAGLPGRVRPQARGRPPVGAVAAGAAGQVERHRHAVADLDPVHPRPHLFDDAHVLVPEHHTRLQRRPPLVGVQVRPADVRGRDADDRIAGLLDLRVVDVLNRKLERPLEHDSLHRPTPFSCGSPRLAWHSLQPFPSPAQVIEMPWFLAWPQNGAATRADRPQPRSAGILARTIALTGAAQPYS